MYKRLFFLIISATILVALYGCHAGGSAPFINTPSESEIYSKEYDVLENGRFADIYLPSGAVIKCTADHTLKPGTKVTATEQKVTSETASNEGTTSYIYSLTGKLNTGDALSTAVLVNSIEKPISVTIPNNSETGLCYLGTRTSESDPWRYTLAQDENQANTRFLRLSQTTQKNPTFKLYRLGIQFALFVFKNESKEETQIDSVVIAPDKDVEIKDGKYTGKLSVKLNVEGENLNGIKSEDLIAKITYRSGNQQGANIDFTTNKNDSGDQAVSGSYEHSFEVSNIKVENTLGNTAELSFELNLDGVSLDDFPKDFLVEFYSKGSDENTRPFEFTQAFSFETKENQPDPQPDPEPQPDPDPDNPDQPSVIYAITYNLDGGEPTGNNPEEYGTASDPITLSNPTKDGYTFLGWTGTDLDNPTTQVIIEKGSTGNREYTANWKQNAADKFTLTLVAGTGIASVDEEKAYKKATSITLNCTVKDGYEFVNWTDSNGNAVTSPFTMPEKAVTLTANAKVITYNLEYFLDGGNFEKDNPKTYNVETENFDLNDPKKDGYAFLGWTSSEITAPLTPVSIKKGSTGDKKFTANWSISSFKLTISKGTGINTVTGDGMHEYNSSVTASCTMLAGYEFDKWTGDFTTETFTMPANNATMTANAKVITYNITYNLDDGQLTTDNPTTYNVETESFSLTNPTKDYYDFLGWSGTGLTGNNNTTVTVSKGSTGAREYTANFTLTNYTITYTNIDGATFATANPTTYNVETETFTLTNPTRTSCEFLGWTYEGQTTPQLEVTITKGSTTGDKTYTANWKLNLTLAIAQDDGAILDGNNNPPLYYTKATFTMTPTVAAGTVMTDTEKSNILSAIIVKDSAGTKFENATATWNNESKIALSFLNDLPASTTFTISFGEIDGVALTYSPFNFKTFYYKGKGTAQVPYQVENAAQLDMVRKYPSYHFKQTADIDLSGYTCWNALCSENSNENATNPFTGVYDGDSKKIKNFTIHSSEFIEYAGLFGFVNAGTIKNLTVDGFSIRGASANTSLNVHYIGIIAAQIENGSSITDCHITDSRVTNATDSASIASLTPYADNGLYAGGICSINNGTITNCSVEKCQIKCSVDNADGVYLGGICCSNSGSISNCDIIELIIACSVTELQLGGICAETYSSSVITNCSVKNTSITGSKGDSGYLYLGGICSNNMGRIEICDIQNTTVKGTGNSRVNAGGISSYNGGGAYSDSITNCYLKDSTVESQGNNCNVGGIAGLATSITSCYIESTTVKSNGGSCYIGGISGTSAAISKCYVKGSEITESSGNTNCQIGGINGYNTKNITSSYLINTNVKGSGLKFGSSTYDYVGGICGYLGSRGSISNCYVYEDNNHSIAKIDSNGAGKLGYLVGLLYKYDSNPDKNAKVTDSFCNLTTSNLSDLVNSVGNESSSSATPDDYGYVTKCYGGVTSENFSGKTWSDGAWSDYSTSSFPPTLK